MKRRVRASMKTRKALEDLFSGRGEGGKSDLVKPATRVILEETVEGEAADKLGREYYARGATAGHRNVYRRAGGGAGALSWCGVVAVAGRRPRLWPWRAPCSVVVECVAVAVWHGGWPCLAAALVRLSSLPKYSAQDPVISNTRSRLLLFRPNAGQVAGFVVLGPVAGALVVSDVVAVVGRQVSGREIEHPWFELHPQEGADPR